MDTNEFLANSDLDAQAPIFVTELHRRGTFRSGALQSPAVDVVIRYNRIEPTPILGHVLGVHATARAFHDFWIQGRPPFSFISEGLSGNAVEARDILIPRCLSNWGPRDTDPIRDIAWFRCDELEEHGGPSGDSLPMRSLTAQVSGPWTSWDVFSIQHLSENGLRLEANNSQIDLGPELGFSVSAAPRLAFDGRDWSPTASFQKVFCITVATDLSTEDYDDDRFANDAEQAVLDLCLLVSLLSRARIEAFDFIYHCSGRSRWVRKVGLGPSSYLKEGSPVFDQYRRAFLRTAFTAYRRLRSAGIDLRLAILQLVSSYRSEVSLVDCFYSAENSLAKLVALLRQGNQDTFTLDEPTIAAVRELIRNRLEEAHGQLAGARYFESIERGLDHKLAELGSSAWDTLERILGSQGVPWSDLYPTGTRRPSLYHTRGRFYHAYQEVEISHLMKELRRCQSIAERLLLKLLGWHDLQYAPSPWVLTWLQSADTD
jgi:hypothetical protein